MVSFIMALNLVEKEDGVSAIEYLKDYNIHIELY